MLVLTLAEYKDAAFTGEGTREYGDRYNSRGTAMVSASDVQTMQTESDTSDYRVPRAYARGSNYRSSSACPASSLPCIAT